MAVVARMTNSVSNNTIDTTNKTEQACSSWVAKILRRMATLHFGHNGLQHIHSRELRHLGGNTSAGPSLGWLALSGLGERRAAASSGASPRSVPPPGRRSGSGSTARNELPGRVARSPGTCSERRPRDGAGARRPRQGGVSGSTLGATDEAGGPRARTAAGSGTRGRRSEPGRSRSTRARERSSTLSSTPLPGRRSRPWARSRTTTTPAARPRQATTASRAASRFATTAGTRPRSASAAHPGRVRAARADLAAAARLWGLSRPGAGPVHGDEPVSLDSAVHLRGSAHYQGLGLTPSLLLPVNSVVNWSCPGFDSFLGRLTPAQKRVAVALSD